MIYCEHEAIRDSFHTIGYKDGFIFIHQLRVGRRSSEIIEVGYDGYGPVRKLFKTIRAAKIFITKNNFSGSLK